ncbi:MAG: hypothetical protein AAF915_25060 [Cyanobacteria bacterium P01_D01_bin.50]
MEGQTGIRQRQLCILGLDYKTVAASAKQLELSTNAYLQQETGPILKNELYYPPDRLKTKQNSNLIEFA